MYKSGVLLINLMVSFLIFTSCYPDNEIYPEETDTVYTTYLPGTDFDSMKYYLLVDSVLRLDSNDFFSNSQYDDLIISRFENNMNKRGFENVAENDSNQIDFMIVITDISQLDITYYWSWLPYGYLYPTYTNGELNAFYPLPSPTNIVVSARTGFLVDILEYDYQQSSDTTKVIWRGISRGAQTQFMDTRIKSNIDRMFLQSPNLKSLK